MTTNDLVALLNDARNELAVLASYVDDPNTEWPNFGLKITAKAHKRMVERIDAALAEESPDEVPLRQENLALRAALRTQEKHAAWRVRYLAVSSALVAARNVIAANRLVLGHYMGVREIKDLEKKIETALGGSQ